MQVNVIGGEISESEKQAYIERARLMFPDRRLVRLDIYIDGEFVELGYYFAAVPFERVRRITGYLAGTVDRWNDAKRAELADRVTHSVNDKSDDSTKTTQYFSGYEKTETDYAPNFYTGW